jgi:hypothetical protein
MINSAVLRSLFSENRARILYELGIPSPTFYRILRRGTCSVEHLVKIACYFDVTIESLLNIPEEFYQ